jgi:hypothetical protein
MIFEVGKNFSSLFERPSTESARSLWRRIPKIESLIAAGALFYLFLSGRRLARKQQHLPSGKLPKQ